MKKIKILVASVLCCAMGYTGYTAYEKMTMSEAEKFMIANVEALTQTEQGNQWESNYQYCRCKEVDGITACKAGNAISIRPACHKAPINSAVYCSNFNGNC